MRKTLAALLLALSAAPAFAQAPPPVPALPDTERRVQYVLSASTCACSIPFAIYGDGADPGAWVQVWINGVAQSPNTWTLTSATGSIATIPRPITNAVLTFTTPVTGTVQIVGNRRPRRASQFAENRGVAARDLNQLTTDEIAVQREMWDRLNSRVVQAPPGEALNPLPPAATRAGQFLGFDGTGQIALSSSVPSGGAAAGSRTQLTGAATFYVANGGTDTSGCGLSPASPCATRNFVWATLLTKYDLQCQVVIISVADGTYTDGFPGNGDPFGNCYLGQITFRGNLTTPANVVIAPVSGQYPFEAQNGAKYFVEGFKLDGSASGAAIAGLIVPTWGSQIGIGKMVYGCAPGTHDIQPGHGTYTFVYSGYTIDKTACAPNASHIQADPTAAVQFALLSTPVTITGAPVYNEPFISTNNADLNLCGFNMSAAITGIPFLVYSNGMIETCAAGGGSATQNPGYFATTAGTATITCNLTAGSTTMTVSGADATKLTNLFGLTGSPNVGLLLVDQNSGLPPSEVIPLVSSISGTNVTLAWPALGTGAHTCVAGGFIYQSGRYYGSNSIVGIPPQP